MGTNRERYSVILSGKSPVIAHLLSPRSLPDVVLFLSVPPVTGSGQTPLVSGHTAGNKGYNPVLGRVPTGLAFSKLLRKLGVVGTGGREFGMGDLLLTCHHGDRHAWLAMLSHVCSVLHLRHPTLSFIAFSL